MSLFSGLALVMLTLVGYSIGATLAANSRRPMPMIWDIGIVIILWVLAVNFREDIGHWASILFWMAIAGLMSALLNRFRAPAHSTHVTNLSESRLLEPNPVRRIWQRWSAFAHVMGNFQGRLLMSLFYFIFISPFGLAVRLLSDPLNLRDRPQRTGWIERPELPAEISDAQQQY